MDRRAPAAVVAANVAATSLSVGVTVESLSSATGVPVAKLTDPFSGPELTWGELQDAGGALSVSPVVFFDGVRRGF